MKATVVVFKQQQQPRLSPSVPSQLWKTLKPWAWSASALEHLKQAFNLNMPRSRGGERTHLKHPLAAGINQGIAIKVTEVTGTKGYLYPAAIHCARHRTGPCADKAQSASAPREMQKNNKKNHPRNSLQACRAAAGDLRNRGLDRTGAAFSPHFYAWKG